LALLWIGKKTRKKRGEKGDHSRREVERKGNAFKSGKRILL